MKKKAWGLGMAMVMLTGIVLTGCGDNGSASKDNAQSNSGAAGQGSDKKTTLEFWAAAITPEREAFWKGVVKDFMAKNPDITVNYLGVPGDLNAYNQKVNVALSAGEAPDMINNFTSDLVARGVLEPLDDYLAKWEGKDKITPGSIASMKSADPKGGKLYGLPYGVQPWVMWIRPDWLKEANLPMPGTWDQFLDDAQKLTDKSKGHYGYGIRGGAGSANTLEMLMYSYSGITNYFTKEGKATINDPLHAQFVEKYLGGYNVNTPEDDLNKGWTELAASFQSGKVGMIFHNLGSASAHEKAFSGDLSKFTAAAFPKSVKGYNVHPGVTPSSMLMLKSSKNKEAVWKFMTYFVLNHNGAYGKLYGEIPPNLDAMKEDWIQKMPYMKTGADLMASADTKFTDNPVYLPNYTSIQQTMEPMIQKVMAKKMSAKDMLDEWAKQLEKAKADYEGSNKGK
ncbi:ABC transporter substrate-binding protein [Paenibacillus rigui]|uniref:ABC transporter substrate-binding protein n=1 Tax=Paenibacillus rigui TaxID=554312 RepID=A0A229UU56_9BACL|nr:sugar ABC transporter substrate-binding protein [Paenibacillus rigui]OXM86948.1 ABC transporter substrate-binding protein [Paenibacillus rigui]